MRHLSNVLWGIVRLLHKLGEIPGHAWNDLKRQKIWQFLFERDAHVDNSFIRIGETPIRRAFTSGPALNVITDKHWLYNGVYYTVKNEEQLGIILRQLRGKKDDKYRLYKIIAPVETVTFRNLRNERTVNITEEMFNIIFSYDFCKS